MITRAFAYFLMLAFVSGQYNGLALYPSLLYCVILTLFAVEDSGFVFFVCVGA